MDASVGVTRSADEAGLNGPSAVVRVAVDPGAIGPAPEPLAPTAAGPAPAIDGPAGSTRLQKKVRKTAAAGAMPLHLATDAHVRALQLRVAAQQEMLAAQQEQLEEQQEQLAEHREQLAEQREQLGQLLPLVGQMTQLQRAAVAARAAPTATAPATKTHQLAREAVAAARAAQASADAARERANAVNADAINRDHFNKEATEANLRVFQAANLVVHGLPEAEDVDAVVLYGTRALGAMRLGPPRPDGAPPRALLLQLGSEAAKHGVLKRSQALRRRGVRLSDHLTRTQMALKSALNGECMRRRAAGERPFWRGARLFFHDAGGHVREHPPTTPGPAASGASASRTPGGGPGAGGGRGSAGACTRR